MELKLESILEEVRVIDEKRDYWFIRTYSGEMYDDFIEKKYVGIGFNNVPYKLIQNSKISDKNLAFEELRGFINNNSDYKNGEATKWAKQLTNFEHNLKIGDVVIIPNRGGHKFSIGIIKSETKVVESPGTFQFQDKYEPYPEKRKTVEWIKTYNRIDFRGELAGLFSTHQGISNAGNFANIIEGFISNLYIKGERMYLKLYMNQDEEINAFDLNTFLSSITSIYKIINKELGLGDLEDLTIKIRLQSKGSVSFAGLAGGALIAIAILYSISDNPKIKITMPLGLGSFEGSADGVLKSFSNFRKANQELDQQATLFEDSLKRLHASDSSVVDSTNADGGDAKDSVKIQSIPNATVVTSRGIEAFSENPRKNLDSGKKDIEDKDR